MFGTVCRLTSPPSSVSSTVAHRADLADRAFHAGHLHAVAGSQPLAEVIAGQDARHHVTPAEPQRQQYVTEPAARKATIAGTGVRRP